ncbi:MAG: hypothetical protein RBT59_09260 [Arcobacteraceae bacterium]|jgi:hypothetical protein|nr:hypothetical protein [Arcobacteraceae bacterium]
MKKEILRGTLLLFAFNVLFADEVKETRDFNKYYEVEKAKCIKTLDLLDVTGETREIDLAKLEVNLDKARQEAKEDAEQKVYRFDENERYPMPEYDSYYYHVYLTGNESVRGATNFEINNRKTLTREERANLDRAKQIRLELIRKDREEEERRIQDLRYPLRYIGGDRVCGSFSIEDLTTYSDDKQHRYIDGNKGGTISYGVYTSEMQFDSEVKFDLDVLKYNQYLVDKIISLYDLNHAVTPLKNYVLEAAGTKRIVVNTSLFHDKLHDSLNKFFKTYKIKSTEYFKPSANPFQGDGLMHMGEEGMVQIIKPKEAFYGTGQNLKHVKTLDMAPNSLKGKVLIKNGAYTYQTSSGRQNTIPSFKEIKVDFSKNAKWLVR